MDASSFLQFWAALNNDLLAREIAGATREGGGHLALRLEERHPPQNQTQTPHHRPRMPPTSMCHHYGVS